MKRSHFIKTPLIIALLVVNWLNGGIPAAEDNNKSKVTPDTPPRGARQQFKTDFSKHSVPYGEFLAGGPSKDDIPAIDIPKFTTVKEAETWLKQVEPVVILQIGEDARAYPLQILIWHEIINDTVGGVPVAVTFCPLCNTAIVFDRRLNKEVFTFGTTGRVRKSNLVMYDRQTESWWQQATGKAVAGELTGRRLERLPAAIISWTDFKAAHPGGTVLSRNTGYKRRYGHNPYAGYDDAAKPPFLLDESTTDKRLPPKARVVTADLNGEAVAYPYDVLRRVHVVNDTVGGEHIAVFWQAGTASALDASSIAEGRDVGSANTFSRRLNGTVLTFAYDGEHIVDEQSGSEWSVVGEAVRGKLAGRRLKPVVNINHFWFSWAAFKPTTRVYTP